ncbi:twin-arginine translocase subunit TatC [Pseudoalteromonas sp. T1lg23B]|uniref:twin-arginine translocase subunit TatC n=1 Tax=Pseudoalteromonas sp. T1lg23B TaxID=2077097 RepID=UPI000CF730FD|nr:twin-arginine translocase subunit TatC [Pseudoalteromonas sp. T1lg23B]
MGHKANKQTIIEHLVEVRNRLVRILAAVLIVFVMLVGFSNDIYSFVAAPLATSLPIENTMIATDVTAPFFAPFKLTLLVSVFAVIPYILHQCWGFIAPGLYGTEKRILIPMLVSSIVLFYSGIAFSYYIVFPVIFEFFASVGPDVIALTPDISSYLSFVIKMFFAFGIVFEIPIATMLLCWSGITSADDLKKHRPYIVVGAFAISMLLTPPDVLSQTMLAIPMLVLFELGLIFSKLVTKQQTDSSDSKALSNT